MKTIKLFSLLAMLMVTSSYFSQAPQAFKYQAIARDASGVPMNNQSVSFQISVLQGSASGTNVYTENHNVSTNSFGLVNLEIGSGSTVSGNFSNITWGSNAYYIQTKLDATGGNSYVLMGTSQLLSVPYALYSESSGSGGGASALNDLTDVNAGAPSANQVLTWNGSQWVASTPVDNNTTYSAGTGLSLSGTTFTNSAPDRTVTLNQSGSTTVSGTYPNFTISSTDNNTTYSAGTGLTLSGSTFSGPWTISGSNIYRNTGNIGIGVTNPINGKLEITGPDTGIYASATGNYNVVVGIQGNATSTNTTGENQGIQGAARNSTTSNNVGGAFFSTGSGTSLNIGVFGRASGSSGTNYAGYFDGNVNVIGSVFQTSDRKLKKDIKDLDLALESIQSLHVKQYNYIDNKMNLSQGNQFGFIAQELEEVYPELVKTQKFYETGKTDLTEYQSINYIGLIPVLTKGIQEQQILIETQQNLIEKLEARITALEGK